VVTAAAAARAGLVRSARCGASVAVRRRHTIGWLSTMAAVVLVLKGLSPDKAWARIAAARGVAVPDTPPSGTLSPHYGPAARPRTGSAVGAGYLTPRRHRTRGLLCRTCGVRQVDAPLQ
jgi:hypothetical protein